MAIVGPWVGWSARTETGEPWMAAAGAVIKLGTPFYMSQMVGRSKELRIVLAGSDHNFNPDIIRNQIPPNSTVRIVINPNVQIVSAGGRDALELHSGNLASCNFIVENYGWLLGRGGDGGAVQANYAHPGVTGRHAIVSNNQGLVIYNYGTIGGGGGGGGSVAGRSGNSYYGRSGGGGAPFGQPGPNLGVNAYNAGGAGSFDTGGPRPSVGGTAQAGRGGNWGQGGDGGGGASGGSQSGGGIAGQACVAYTAVDWAVLGQTYGIIR